MTRTRVVLLLTLLSFAGCTADRTEDTAVDSGTAEPAAPGADTQQGPVTIPGSAAVPGPMEQVEAKPGVGVEGQSLKEHSGPLVTPANAFFQFKQKTVFEIQIPQAMQLFKATEGRNPNSHDEFMSRIIQANNINLPELPPGHKYIYDPASGQLKVERPAQ